MRFDRLPLTYDECRARFRRAVAAAALQVDASPISAVGPEGQALTVDAAMIGADLPRRCLVVMSGVHGVEGFIGSALQSDLLGRLDGGALPPDVGVLLIHAVNPWGMAWWRRQNESNVDLNRNWRRNDVDPTHNDAYDELHPLACPVTRGPPSVERALLAAMDLAAEHGLEWVRDGINRGQYRHPDGLHFGGDRTEESCTIVERVVGDRLSAAERVLVLDLHTGHGPRREVTFLSDAPPGSPQDRFLREHFAADRIAATVGNPDATTGVKSGQIANGIRDALPAAARIATSVEFGTASDEEQFAATYLEHWVHRLGDRRRPDHADIVWAYRNCFTPDDPEWERWAVERGRSFLGRAVGAVAGASRWPSN